MTDTEAAPEAPVPVTSEPPEGQEGFAGGTMAALGSGTLGSFALAAAPAWPVVLGALALGGVGGYFLTRRMRNNGSKKD